MADTWQWLNGVVMGHNAGHADCFDCKCLLYFACQLSLVSPVSRLILAINIPLYLECTRYGFPVRNTTAKQRTCC